MAKDIQEMLSKEYTLTLQGGVLGYIIALLAEAQGRLNDAARDNITDIQSAMEAAANSIAGNEVLFATYRAAGAEFTAFAIGVEPDTIKKVLETDMSPKEMAEAILKDKARQKEKNKRLN